MVPAALDGDGDGAPPGADDEYPLLGRGPLPVSDPLLALPDSPPGQSGEQRRAATSASAPPIEKPPPEKPCGLEAPNFWSCLMNSSVPAVELTEVPSSPALAIDGSSRTCGKPASAIALLTLSWPRGLALSATTRPLSVIWTGVSPTLAPSTTVVAMPLGSPLVGTKA